MSPTVHREGPYRYFFFSREEPRMHVHVQSAEGEAKFWLEPTVALAVSHGLKPKDLAHLQRIIEEHADAFRLAWQKHFAS